MLNRLSLSLVLAAVFASGCTAVNAQLHIEKAESSLARAKERGADAGALYEWTLAERYLAKAQEEVRQNHFGAAEVLADSAASYADQSIIALESQGRDLEIDESTLDTLPDRIGTDLVDEVEVQIDYVDLPPGELPTSADDVITDDEVEALFGRDAVDAMHGEGPEAEGETPDGAEGTPGEGGEDATPTDEATPTDGTTPTEEAVPAEEAAPTEGTEDGWQDLNAGDDEL